MRIAYQPISHSATGIHFEPVQDGPYRARLSIGHSNSIRLDQFRKNSWCSVGIDGYREVFVRPAWIFSMLSGGLSPIPICRRDCARATTRCGTRAVVEGLFMGIVLASVSLTALRSGDRWADISGAYAFLESLQHFVPSNTTGVRTLRHHSVHSGGSGNSSRRTVVPV